MIMDETMVKFCLDLISMFYFIFLNRKFYNVGNLDEDLLSLRYFGLLTFIHFRLKIEPYMVNP
jgi:hypothetical protein